MLYMYIHTDTHTHSAITQTTEALAKEGPNRTHWVDGGKEKLPFRKKPWADPQPEVGGHLLRPVGLAGYTVQMYSRRQRQQLEIKRL